MESIFKKPAHVRLMVHTARSCGWNIDPPSTTWDHWLMNDWNLRPTDGHLLEGASLLLVDDDSRVGLALARVLNLEGAVVVVARDGEDAIDVLERDKAELLDVVVTDLETPVVSGHEWIAVLQECRPGLPIVAMTAYTPPMTFPAAMPLFYKPFSAHELVLTLVPLVRQSQERRRQLRQMRRRIDSAPMN